MNSLDLEKQRRIQGKKIYIYIRNLFKLEKGV